MNKTIQFLSVLLVAQLLLAGVLLFSAPDLAAVRPDTPLLDPGDRQVDRLLIEGGEGERAVLEKKDEGWVLPDPFGFPVEKGKVEGLLDGLKDLRRGFPVATTKGALTRFKVTDENFERRITLMQGDETLEKIYLGSSPGIRRIHARTDGDETVYSVDFSAHRASAKNEDWEDKTVIIFPREELESIHVAGLTLRRAPAPPVAEAEKPEQSEDTPTPQPLLWIAEGLAEGESLDEEGVSLLVRRLSDLRTARVMGLEPKPEYMLETPKLRLGYTRKGAGSVEYVVGKPESEPYFVLKASHRPEYFQLHNYVGEPLVEAAVRDGLVKKDEPEAENGAAAEKTGPKTGEEILPEDRKAAP